MTSTSAPSATASTAARAASGSAERSAFVSTTTGTAPESQATESSRSMRRRLGGSAIGWTTNTVSILAASTWTSEAFPGSPRVMALVRSSTASMSGSSRSSAASTATQSPTAGRSRRAAGRLQEAGGELRADDPAPAWRPGRCRGRRGSRGQASDPARRRARRAPPSVASSRALEVRGCQPGVHTPVGADGLYGTPRVVDPMMRSLARRGVGVARRSRTQKIRHPYVADSLHGLMRASCSARMS